MKDVVAERRVGVKDLAAEDRAGWVPLALSDRVRDLIGLTEVMRSSSSAVSPDGIGWQRGPRTGPSPR